MIVYIKGKETEIIIIIKHKVLKDVMFCNSNYSTYKETIKGVSDLFDTLGRTLLTCLSKTPRTVTLISTEAEYMALSSCTQEVNFVSMLLEEIPEVQKPSVIYEDKQGTIILPNNRQVGMRIKHIFICHHFLKRHGGR